MNAKTLETLLLVNFWERELAYQIFLKQVRFNNVPLAFELKLGKFPQS